MVRVVHDKTNGETIQLIALKTSQVFLGVLATVLSIMIAFVTLVGPWVKYNARQEVRADLEALAAREGQLAVEVQTIKGQLQSIERSQAEIKQNQAALLDAVMKRAPSQPQ